VCPAVAPAVLIREAVVNLPPNPFASGEPHCWRATPAARHAEGRDDQLDPEPVAGFVEQDFTLVRFPVMQRLPRLEIVLFGHQYLVHQW
jgi:hypothetical protein